MKTFGATDWCFAAMASAFAFPFYLFASLTAIDVIEYMKKSSATVPPFTIIVMGFIWASLFRITTFAILITLFYFLLLVIQVY